MGVKRFEDYPYQRIDLEKVKDEFEAALTNMAVAENFQKFDEAVKEVYKIRNLIETMATVASVRFSIDMNDAFYERENAFYDEVGPVLEGYNSRFYKVLTTSQFAPKAEEVYGRHLMNVAKVSLRTFSEEIVPLMQEENKLTTSYSKLVGNAKIELDGKTYNMSTISPMVQNVDRATRKRAQEAISTYFAANQDTLDDLYDQLVKVRHAMALKLGYENFVELGYARLGRTDYNAADVAVFRDEVKKHIVPLSVKLHEQQAKDLGLEKLMYYDKALTFLDGNPKPAGDEAYLVGEAKKMYQELSAQTGEFFDFMTDKNLLSLDSRDGKRPGGYCTYMPDYDSPFIFANFNGTDHDVTVLTHEAGHAFQVYRSRGYEISEYQWPTLEACEIHSMSMEYLTYPWMERFFGEDVGKFVKLHASEPIRFIPYGVQVDDFQHFVYEHPEATPEERRSHWAKLTKVYQPDTDYEDNTFLVEGGFWFRQGHIFRTPFYYIDYTLALTCATQFYHKSLENREATWEDYLRLCDAGGSKPFTQLLEVANLESPFKEGTVEKVIAKVATEVFG